jgi:pimeloyl-ACP methyl ester carboxylesterase
VAALTGWGTSEYAPAAGTRMHAAVAGPEGAPTVVCVHGLGCSHRYFLPFARALWDQLRVAAVDLPGFGRSRGPAAALDVRGLSLALASWLRVTGRGGSVLVGNSSGCQVLVDLAVHSPDLLGPVVLAGPTFDSAARRAPRQLGRLLADMRWERPGLGPVLARDWSACGARRYWATYRFLQADPVERKLRHVTSQAVVVRGGRDRIVPRRWAQEVTANLPKGRFAEIPGTGHTLNWSAPVELARLTRPLVAEGAP